MNKSEQINELAAALAKAQAKMKNPSFDSANPFFKSKYASLAAVRNAVLPVFAEEGLSVVQEITHSSGISSCASMLLHSSGQWLELAPFSVPVAKADAQGACAGATYTRRAALQALAGVVGDEDDDAESVVPRASEGAKKYVPKLTKTGPPDPIGPVGEIPDSTAASPSGANADPAAGRAASSALAVGFLNNFEAASTVGQIDSITKQIALIAGKFAESDKASLRDAMAAARLRVAANPVRVGEGIHTKLVDVPNLLRELTGLRSQLGDAMFLVMLKNAGGEERAGYGLSADKLVALRDEAMKAIGV